MFIVSSKYHSLDHQRREKNNKRYLEYQKIDILFAYLLIFNNSFIIFKNYKKHKIICLLSGFIAISSFIFYYKYAEADYVSDQIYDKYHPYWHISTGIGSAILFLY